MARQVKNKVKRMLITFFDLKGSVHKEFVLARQTVNSAYYCDILRRLRENMRRLHPELWRQKNWLLHHNAPSHTSFVNIIFFYKKNTTLVSHPPYFSLYPQLKLKLKGRYFDKTKVIEAESQAVQNTTFSVH
jgi:hypothetical protein